MSGDCCGCCEKEYARREERATEEADLVIAVRLKRAIAQLLGGSTFGWEDVDELLRRLSAARGTIAAMEAEVKPYLEACRLEKCQECRGEGPYGEYQESVFVLAGFYKHGIEGHFIECSSQAERRILAILDAHGEGE